MRGGQLAQGSGQAHSPPRCWALGVLIATLLGLGLLGPHTLGGDRTLVVAAPVVASGDRTPLAASMVITTP